LSAVWHSDEYPDDARITAGGWLRVILRGGVIIGLIALCLPLLLIARGFERLTVGARRPVSAFFPKLVSRVAFYVLGIKHTIRGEQMRHAGAVVSNHGSWLDIFALNARKRVFFVSKAEVSSWPGIGFMARSTGTVFINRDRREARQHIEQFEERLRAGHKLLFFPEGTSTDTRRVLPFKTTLFAAFYAPELIDLMHIQPVTLIYRAPEGADARFYGWWGDMEFGPHLLSVLASRKQGSVEVVYHEPLCVRDFADRKALAAHCEAVVRSAL
jgi:1-acyl-sn-glycerol-3-phosphate acyltransferase